jgi:branched-chain amino acid transport system ATP-binding protein
VRRARRGLGRTFQRIESFGSLTVRDNIEIAAEAAALGDSPLALLGLTRRRTAEVHQVADEVMARTGLGDDGELLARQLSTGNARLLELARCLARQPRLLLLDEPSSGLNPEETERFGALLLDLVIEDGIGILLVEHDMSLALTVCERLLVLDFGEELFVGAPAEIRASSTVRKAYLGAMEEV